MIKTLIPFLVIVLACLYIGNITVTFIPFSFKMQRPVLSIGFFLFIIGFALVMQSKYDEGKKVGEKEAMDIIKEVNQIGKEGGE